MKVCVYTRDALPDCYPEGLARAVHFACVDENGTKVPFNRNYGILFARAGINADNTIVPLGIANPVIFKMYDGVIGIAGERVYENGTPDETAKGKLVLWKTKDLIHFEDETLVLREEALCPGISDSLAIDDDIVEQAKCYWDPVVCTGISLPGEAEARTGEELDGIRAVISYSDGSRREKSIYWDKAGVSFDKPGKYAVCGRILQQNFEFPLSKGYGDPVVFLWEGKWYFISTNDNLNDIGIYVREADTVDELFTEGITEHLILPFDPSRGLEQTFWAPEFHVIGGELYILFAVSGHAWGPQCHMMRKKKGKSITLADSWEDPVRVIRADGEPLAKDAITLDMTFIRAGSGSYVIWSYREHIGTKLDTGSMLYIATIDEREPWKLTSDPVLLTRPLYGWENVSGTINNEGPYGFVRDGRVFVTYSGGAANGYTYALGLLTADETSNLLDISSWHKSISPVLTFYSVKGEFGPGHNSFFENEEGELMIAYHGETDIKSHLRCDGIRRVHFRADGTPYFQMSKEEDVQSSEVKLKIRVK
ncbi:MAG: family 43 glycosylhydrolase [Lachnospiraceae bacterium]|nr:family 43 glycosylhydrolase [Lachnospiraceae bacterium]